MDIGTNGASDDDEFVPPPPWTIVRHIVLGLLAIFGIVFVLGLTLRAPIEYYSKLIVGSLGLTGVFAGVVLLDSTPFLTHEPILFTAYFAKYPPIPLAAVLAAGSLTAACINWVGGRFLGNHIPPLQRLLKRYKIKSFIDKYGALAVVGGAMLPMPFAIIGWGAGAAGAPFWAVFAGGLVRALKIVAVLLFLHLGWTAGTPHENADQSSSTVSPSSDSR
jgi:membrane protein YqaA with SNARE-associated domain